MAAATAVSHWLTAAVAMVTCEEQQVRKRGVETAEEQFGFNLLVKTLVKSSVDNNDVTKKDVNK